MSLTVDGVWKVGVWATTVWASGVWNENTISNQIGSSPTLIIATPSVSIQSKVTPTRPQFSAKTGIVPFTVFCDSGTIGGASRPFHNLEYTWAVLDQAGVLVTWGNWSYGRQISQSVQTGPTAAFVFETVGTFNILCYVVNGTTVTTFLQTITATAAIGVLDVHNFSTSGDYTGAPAGTNHGSWATGVDAAISAHGGSGKMLCFRGGETFTWVTASTLTNVTTMYVGGYAGFGTGLPKYTPVNAGTDVRVLTVTGSSSDIKLVDFEMDGGGDGDLTGIVGSGAISRVLMLRLYLHDLGGGIEIPLSLATAVYDQISFIGGRLETFNATSAFHHAILFASTRGALIGSNLSDTNHGSAEHLLRAEYLNKGVIRSNTFALSAATKEMIGLRAPAATSAGTAGNYFPSLGLIGEAAATEKVCVSDNLVLTNTFAGIKCGPVNPDHVFYLQDVIIERNYYNQTATGGYGVNIASCNNITIRNEIVEGDALTDTGVLVASTAANGVSSDIDIYNLSFYTTRAANDIRAISVSLQNNINIDNCAGWAPNQTGGAAMIFGTPVGSGTIGIHNTTNANLRLPAVRPYTGAAPAAVADYIPNPAGSPTLIGAGSTAIDVHVFDDYNDASRTGTIDMGATEV